MELQGYYRQLADYFNGHTDYKMNESNVTDCRRNYDKYGHTAYRYVIAEEGNLQMECQHKESKHWGDEGEWIICKVWDRSRKEYLLATKEEVDKFFGESDII